MNIVAMSRRHGQQCMLGTTRKSLRRRMAVQEALKLFELITLTRCNQVMIPCWFARSALANQSENTAALYSKSVQSSRNLLQVATQPSRKRRIVAILIGTHGARDTKAQGLRFC